MFGGGVMGAASALAPKPRPASAGGLFSFFRGEEKCPPPMEESEHMETSDMLDVLRENDA
jgi:hypothetical protein